MLCRVALVLCFAFLGGMQATDPMLRNTRQVGRSQNENQYMFIGPDGLSSSIEDEHSRAAASLEVSSETDAESQVAASGSDPVISNNTLVGEGLHSMVGPGFSDAIMGESAYPFWSGCSKSVCFNACRSARVCRAVSCKKTDGENCHWYSGTLKKGCRGLEYGGTCSNPEIIRGHHFDVYTTWKKLSTSSSPALNSTALPSNCEVSAWTLWSACTTSCATGKQTRHRTITQNQSNGGTCHDTLQSSRPCRNMPCPVDCVLEEWSAWGNCTPSCENGTSENGTQNRTREIKILDAHGGAICNNTFENQTCNASNETCPQSRGTLQASSSRVVLFLVLSSFFMR